MNSLPERQGGQPLSVYRHYQKKDINAIIMYMTTLPLAEARAQLSKLVEEASSTHERIEITKNGHRAAVLLGVDDYDSMLATIEVLSDTALLSEHQHGLDELLAGNSLSLDDLARALNGAGRHVDPN